MSSSGNGGAEDATDELGKTLKEGERVLAPTRRPDGTLRKPVRIRAGYVPQDEVAVYQSNGALWKKEISAMQEVPPGYDQVVESKPKSKSAKRNERKKEKRQQAAVDKDKNDDLSADNTTDLPDTMETVSSKMNGLSLSGNASLVTPPTNSTECPTPEDQAAVDKDKNDDLSADNTTDLPGTMETVSSKMNGLSLSGNASLVTPPTNSTECPTPEDQVQDIDKKIRALKKKVSLYSTTSRLSAAKNAGKDTKPDQLDKVTKLEGWRNELKLLEDKKAELGASIS
ncbi:hypothetical protein DH2020_045104 [Rehmannia glutinosa]|uniref:WIBG Mago-binding domain-containing protein n=1 Tax=Rehmannia glutinosa TaxID=99300 RepID=A0ABR0UF52_REHGL